MKKSIRKTQYAELQKLKDPNLSEFSDALIPGTKFAHLGVRLPELRKIAKQTAKDDWRAFLQEKYEEKYLEEIMIRGMVIGYAEMNPGEREELVRDFVPEIDNWGLCDTFCASLHSMGKTPERTWEFLQPFLKSNREFEIRFGVVMLLAYFINEKYLKQIFRIFDSINHDGYYVKMGVAWALSMVYVKFPKQTEPYLKNNKLDDATHNKALQKIIESRCVSPETKDHIRTMKRKKKKT